jgi:hypothetical protein
MAVCKACGAQIYFVTMRDTAAHVGRMFDIDPKKLKQIMKMGRIAVEKKPVNAVLCDKNLDQGIVWPDVYVAHWPNCSESDTDKRE